MLRIADAVRAEMASAKSLVSVRDHGVEVEIGLRRPVRLTPDGFAGVAYAGSVYPLHVGDFIELSGPSWELADCEKFLLAGAEIPYAVVGLVEDAQAGFDLDWYVETNRFGHYVVFNAPEPLAGRLIAALEQASVNIQRWDVSHRAADDGNIYDWFARLRFKGPREEALAMVRQVISPAPCDGENAVPRINPLVEQLADAEARIELLLDRVFMATQRIESGQREIGQLREVIDAAEAMEKGQRESLMLAKRRQVDLENQISALRRQVGSGPDQASLVKDLADAEELREMALTENAILLERTRSLEAESISQRQRANELQIQVDVLMDQVVELQTLEEERLRAAAARRPRRGGVVEFLEITFSRIEFVLDSIEVIANLDSPAAIMRALAVIDAGDLVGKDLEGIRGWFEVTNLATGIAGSQRLGRIYYKPGGQRVLVNVHVKQDDKQQRRHLERLRAF